MKYTYSNDKANSEQWTLKPVKKNSGPQFQQAHPASIIQRARINPGSLAASDVLQLQRTIGNRAVQRMLQTHAEDLKVDSVGTTGSYFAYDFSRIPVHASAAGTIQVKPIVNVSGDVYEQEADAVAEQVMRTATPVALQVQRQTEKEKLSLRKTTDDAQMQIAPPIVDQVMRLPGQPLDAAIRTFMEPRFGYDFSRVRVHADGEATNAARAVQARAYTIGSDIVFGGGQYHPANSDGKLLIAHELAHVVQQTGMRPASQVARVIQRQQPSGTAQPTVAPPQVTQQLYNQAVVSIASRAGVNPTLLAILQQGRISQTVRGVHSATSTMQVSIPAAPGSPGGATSVPAVRILFDLEISPNTAQLPTGAFAGFVNDPATQTSFSGQAATGQTITRLLKIITKAPVGGTAADTLGEAMVHEGTHMLLAIDGLLSSMGIQGLSSGMTGAQTAFAMYVQAATSSSLRNALITSLVAEVNRVFTPAGATAPTISATDANTAVVNVITLLLEERFAVDQQLAAYPNTVSNTSNTTLAGAYLWDLLADETSRKPWPQGSGAQTLVTAMAAFLDDVHAILNPLPPSGSP